MLTPMQIKDTFVKRDDIDMVLYSIKSKIEIERNENDSQVAQNNIAKSWKNKIVIKLNTIFRRQLILDGAEAIKYYSTELDSLNERVELLFHIIEYINEDLKIDYIPDRLTVCAYFRINAEIYDKLVNDISAEISAECQAQFRNIEEFIISLTTNGIENGVINGYAWKRMQLQSKYGGNEIKSVETSNANLKSAVVITTSSEVSKRMGTTYNFEELTIEDKK